MSPMLIYFCIFVISFLVLIKWKFKSYFAWLISQLCKGINKKLKDEKIELFYPLNELAVVKGKHQVKVLELGGGSGANFGFIWTPVQWTVTEPNICFQSYFKENVSKFGGDHQIGEMKVALGEDLSQFEENSFDAVIATNVLCSVQNVAKVLSESKRVLKPGGIFYFFDHVRAKSDQKLMCKIQDFLSDSGLWPAMGDGCHLNRLIGDQVKSAGYARTNVKTREFINENNFILRRIQYGHAIK